MKHEILQIVSKCYIVHHRLDSEVYMQKKCTLFVFCEYTFGYMLKIQFEPLWIQNVKECKLFMCKSKDLH